MVTEMVRRFELDLSNGEITFEDSIEEIHNYSTIISDSVYRVGSVQECGGKLILYTAFLRMTAQDFRERLIRDMMREEMLLYANLKELKSRFEVISRVQS